VAVDHGSSGRAPGPPRAAADPEPAPGAGLDGDRCGVVIGHYNGLAFLELNLRLIREHCGDIPILISDDCSPGFGPDPPPHSAFGRLLALQARYGNLRVWPNPTRIGHMGGDLAAVWKGIIWAKGAGLGFLAKLSQRCVIDRKGWLQAASAQLRRSGHALLGRSCMHEGFNIRTEALVLDVEQWHRPDILMHLVPRRIQSPVEQVLWEDVQHRLDGNMAHWELLSPSRYTATPDAYFRAANPPADYERLARRVGLDYTAADFDTTRSDRQPDYLQG
jgi:hypothetical protein